MKKLFSIIAFTSLIMMSCRKDFIDLLPISSVSTDILYHTDKDFKDAIIAAYDPLQEQYQEFWIFGDMRADDSWQEKPANDWHRADAFITTSSDELMSSTWRNYYLVIYRINTILSKIKDADVSVVTNKERYIAEAKFLRAFAYFDLVRIFGDVSMVTLPLSIEESYKSARVKVDKLYDEIIIPDLLAAENGLPLSYSGNDVGKPTKGAAKALLGRVYLTRNDFQKAEIKLQEVTTLGYALLPVYNDLFNYTKNEHHKEYIFDIEYEKGIGEGNRFTNYFLPNSNDMCIFFGVGGFGYERNSPTQLLMNLFASNDQRKDISVGVYGGFIGAGGAFIKIQPSTMQTYTKKYIAATSAMYDSPANWKVIRYADVLLMYAEALNENGKTTQALPYLNQVRTRAGLAGYTALNQSDTRIAIVRERRLELSFEGVRWFDLLRTGQAYNVMKDYGMQPYMTVFPLPLSQVQLINNPDIFPQNPGY